MKHIIAALLLAGAALGATTPAHATPSSDGYTPKICVSDGCTDGGPGKPRR